LKVLELDFLKRRDRTSDCYHQMRFLGSNATEMRPGPRWGRLQVTHSQFHATTFHLVLVLFVSQLAKYGIPYLLTFCSLKHSLHLDVI